MTEERCLTLEAIEKCQCYSCKLRRELSEICLKQIIELEMLKIHNSALKEAGIVPK
jgi:hypothetical protein